MPVTLNETSRKRDYFSHKQVVATAATVVSAQEPKTFSTMAHFRKKWISFKDEFHSDKPNNKTRKNWKIWKKRTCSKTTTEQQQALFNFNLPIVISSTHNYYEKQDKNHYYIEQRPSQSIVQQLTIIPSFNANLLLVVILVALLVIAFGILQIHRTISILNIGIDLLRHTLITSISITRTVMTSFFSFFF